VRYNDHGYRKKEEVEEEKEAILFQSHLMRCSVNSMRERGVGVAAGSYIMAG